jgi:NAD(P) transhydrogenase subunit alpha
LGQIVFIPAELDAGEPRVAASADTVKRIAALGFEVIVETGAGRRSRITDEEFARAGAAIGTAA